MKHLKKLIIPIISGSLIFYGCENKDSKKTESEKVEKQPTELDKYNLDNKQIYDDFFQFCIENPNKKNYDKSLYMIKFSNPRYFVDFTEKGELNVWIRNVKNFYDEDGKGLDDKSYDSQVFKEDKLGLVKSEYIKDLSLEKQLETAKEYTTLLKEIMHEEKYKKY